jgi:hypothetical protein
MPDLAMISKTATYPVPSKELFMKYGIDVYIFALINSFPSLRWFLERHNKTPEFDLDCWLESTLMARYCHRRDLSLFIAGVFDPTIVSKPEYAFNILASWPTMPHKDRAALIAYLADPIHRWDPSAPIPSEYPSDLHEINPG